MVYQDALNRSKKLKKNELLFSISEINQKIATVYCCIYF